MNITINYPFEELNNATLLNCDIYLRKKKYPNDKISIICPSRFKDIFQSADKIYEIKDRVLKDFGIKNYEMISEYIQRDSRLLSYSTRFKNFFFKYKYIYNLLNKILNDQIKIFLFQKFFNTSRTQRFWLDNKLKDYCIKKNKINNYFHTNLNIDLVGMQTDLFSDSWYDKKFERLKEKIHDGVFLEIKNKNDLSNKCLKILSNINYKTIIFRTRNFNNKNKVNSNYSLFFNIIKKLLKKRFRIIELGFPKSFCAGGVIKDKNYFQYDNDLSFGDEYYLLNKSRAVFSSTRDNNFITLSNCKINLIIHDRDSCNLWSNKSIGLLKEREKFFTDIDISEEILNKKIDLAIDKILLHLSV